MEQGALLYLAMSVALICQPSAASASRQEDSLSGRVAEQQIVQLEKEWAAAGPKGDISVFERIAADDYVIVDIDGSARTKQEEIANFRHEEQTAQTVDEISVRIHDRAAVAVGRFTIAGTYDGKPNDIAGRFTDVWFNRNGRWRLVSSQNTMLSEQAATEKHPDRPAAESDASDRQTLIELERGNWEAFKHEDAAFLEKMLAQDYFDFGSDGRESREYVLNAGLKDPKSKLLDLSWTDFQIRFIRADIALLTYRGRYRRITDGKPDVGEAYYSSLYEKRQGKWLMLFTQDSNLKCAGM